MPIMRMPLTVNALPLRLVAHSCFRLSPIEIISVSNTMMRSRVRSLKGIFLLNSVYCCGTSAMSALAWRGGQVLYVNHKLLRRLLAQGNNPSGKAKVFNAVF